MDFVLNILREVAIEEEQSLFGCHNTKFETTIQGTDSLENLRDPFIESDSENEDEINTKVILKKSINAKYKKLKSTLDRPHVKTPELVDIGDEGASAISRQFEQDLVNLMESIGVEAYKAEKQREADELEAALRKSRGKKKHMPKPKVIDESDVESLTGFSKIAEMHERPDGFPITPPHYNMLKDPTQLDWLQSKSVPDCNKREDSKRKCVKWLMEKT